MRTGKIILLLVAFLATQARAQKSPIAPKREVYIVRGSEVDDLRVPYLPKLAVQTNLLYWAAATPNVALEFGLAKRWSVALGAAYNPFQLQKGGTNQIWFTQPEFRYWFCQRFENHFVGVHAIYGGFNIGQVGFLSDTLVDHRYKGAAYGAGIAWGYHLPTRGRWAWEFSLGAGYVVVDYDKYNCAECDDLEESKKHRWLGPTKAAVTLMYIIK
jgi:hypothetical protein